MEKKIRGYSQYTVDSLGRVWSERSRKYLAPALSHGYKRVDLCKKGTKKLILVHRLVAEAFVPKRRGAKQVNHINSNRADNRASNLAWVTASENMQHGFKFGYCVVLRGSKNGFSRLKEAQVIAIRKALLKGTPRKLLAVKYGVSNATIVDIHLRRSWAHL